MTKHTLITGGALRIGAALTRHLAHQGYAVTIHCRNSIREAEALAGEIGNSGGRAQIVKADLAVLDDVTALEAEAARGFGPIDVLVNNASTFEPDEIEHGTITPASWQTHLNANLQAPVFLAQAVAARLPDGADGNIINLIDQRVWALTPKFFSYTLSKAALWTATQTMAQALAPRIRVNGIGPGPTLPNIRQKPEDFANQIDATLLQTQPQLSEFTAAVDFILAAKSMTGQMIALDSGQHLAWETPDVMGAGE